MKFHCCVTVLNRKSSLKFYFNLLENPLTHSKSRFQVPLNIISC